MSERRTRAEGIPPRRIGILARAVLAAAGLVAGSLSAEAQIVEYYHTDAVGSVRVVSDANGGIVERHDYLPFGEEWNAQAGTQPKRFTGKERDPETGLDYFGARYYSSKVGRFTTTDPVYTWNENLVDPQRWNRYAYALNNPLRYVDPDGRTPAAAALEFQQAARETYAGTPPNLRIWVAGGIVVAGAAVILSDEDTYRAIKSNALSTFAAMGAGGAGLGPDPFPHAQSWMNRKTAGEMANDLAGKIGKNSVPFETPSTTGHIDLKGKGHFDKPTGQEIPTPHVQTRPKNVGPNGKVNLGPETTKPATKADIRTAKKLTERKQ